MLKSDKILFSYLFVFLLMSIGAICWQLLVPTIATNYSTWNLSLGWQREIALWNIGVDAGIIYTLIKRNKSYAEILSIIVTVLCIVLGVNHLFAAIIASGQNTALHWLGAFEVLFFGGGFGIFALFKSRLFKE